VLRSKRKVSRGSFKKSFLLARACALRRERCAADICVQLVKTMLSNCSDIRLVKWETVSRAFDAQQGILDFYALMIFLASCFI
jgi:hypothetical protein